MIEKIGVVYNKEIYFDELQSPSEYNIIRKSKNHLPSGMVIYSSVFGVAVSDIVNDDYKPESDDYFTQINCIVGGSKDLDFYKKVLDGCKSIQMLRDERIDDILDNFIVIKS